MTEVCDGATVWASACETMRVLWSVLDRRSVIAWLALSGAGAVMARPRRDRAEDASVRPVDVPVNAGDERVVGTIVGLRPYRRSGFVVRVEKLDAKTVIHNYGHGGGGVTLSWGTAGLAADLAGAVASPTCAVMGCGAVGLATARLLQRRGRKVTIYARDLPPDTTSNVAGGQWSPFSVFDPFAVEPAFRQQFVQASRLAYDAFRELVGPRYGVHWRANYWVGNREIRLPGFFSDLAELYPDLRRLEPDEHPFPRRHAWRFSAMHIDPPIYLERLLRDYRQAGGRVEVRTLRSLEDVANLPQPLVVNCTGLGSHALFSDTELEPMKGQLTVLRRQKDVRYNVIADGGLYMMPRSDGIVLGGSWDRVWDRAADPAVVRRVLLGHHRLNAAFRDSAVGTS